MYIHVLPFSRTLMNIIIAFIHLGSIYKCGKIILKHGLRLYKIKYDTFLKKKLHIVKK